MRLCKMELQSNKSTDMESTAVEATDKLISSLQKDT